MNPTEINMSFGEFNELFPFHLLLSEDCTVVSAGSSLQKIYPVAQGSPFFDLFRVVQPTIDVNSFDALKNQNSVVLLRTSSGPTITLRGQWKKLSALNQLVFIGSPWFHSWEEVKELDLKVTDFAPHDAILDLLLAQKTQEIASNDLKLVLEKMSSNEAFYRIFQKFPSLVWRARSSTSFDYFNDTWVEFTGRTVEQESGTGWYDGIHADDRDNFTKTFTESFEKRQAFMVEYRLKHHSGEYRWIRDYGQPYFDKQGGFAGFVGSCYDVTENKEYENKLRELNETKDRLFSIIGHDLRNPLINIVGLVDLLQKNYKVLDTATTETIINNLHAASQTTFELLKSLLEWSRSQQKEIKFEPKNLDAEKVCHDILGVLKPIAEQKHITMHCPNLAGLTIYADENMFKTVMRNLVSNAIKFTKEKGNIALNVNKVDHSTRFTISDDGVGIPQDRLPYLFDATQKFSSNGTRNEVGTGLGLSLCKHFIERHNGTIHAESQEGKGTDIIFTLPDEKQVEA